ncbi:MAG TPA: hypothetical protein VGJ22_03795 [Anaerolineales bacterium]|jgi:hypothetical protein
MQERSPSRGYSLIFILAFIGMLLLPLRTLALDPAGIEENFYGRTYLIKAIANLRIWLGDRVFPKVLVGDAGWLVYTAENDIEGYQHADPFADSELSRIQHSLDELSVRYEEHGTVLLVVVPPNKNTIYPERVPPQIPILGEASSLDQLVAYLHEHGKTQILDLRPTLRAARAQQEIYYATDTHWNDYGAFAAYEEILTALRDQFPALTPRPVSDFRVVRRAPEILDLADNIGTTLLPESKIQFVPLFDTHTTYKTLTIGGRRIQFSHNPDEGLPTAIVYHDSFFFRVIPLLGEHFSNAMFIQNYVGGGLWSLSWVDEQKPSIVIIEFSERQIHDLPLLIDPE